MCCGQNVNRVTTIYQTAAEGLPVDFKAKKRKAEKKQLKQNTAKNKFVCGAKNLSLRGDTDNDRPAGSNPSNTASKITSVSCNFNSTFILYIAVIVVAGGLARHKVLTWLPSKSLSAAVSYDQAAVILKKLQTCWKKTPKNDGLSECGTCVFWCKYASLCTCEIKELCKTTNNRREKPKKYVKV